MEEWKEYKLGDLYDVHNGLSKGGKFFGSGYPFLSFKTVFNNYFLPPVLPDLVQSDEKEQGGYDIKRGDVFVTRTSETPEELGMSSVALKDYPFATYNGFTKRLRPKDTSIIYPEFIGYYLRSTKFRALFYGLASSMSTRASLANGDLLGMKVFLPTFSTQEKIASILKSLDDKIEVNRKINENLEQQAQALFKSWFVDFEPFKDGEFVESELGMIPKGWRMGALGDICVTNKRSYKGDFAHEIEYIDTGSVTNNVIESTQFLNPATDKIPSRARRAVTEGDIIYSSVRPNQRHFALLFNPASNTVVSTGFVVITANWSGYRYYIYQYLIQDEIVDKLQAIAEQSVSTFPSLNAADITNLKIVIPPNDIVGDFAAICCSFIQQIEKNQQESRRLATLRDTLLPKLMSGELKVNEVEI